MPLPWSPELPHTMLRVHGSLNEEAFKAADRRGSAMPVDQANNYAIAEIVQALTALHANLPQ